MFEKEKQYFSSERKEMLKFIPHDAKKILDIGCGVGAFAQQLCSDEREIWGLEPDEHSAIVASEKLYKVISGKVEDKLVDIPDHYFDLIVFNDVLEHLLYPWDILEKVKTKLASNGKLVCSIPNVRYIRNLGHVLVNRDWQYGNMGILDSTHFRFFTKKSMINLFKNTNYKILSVKGINPTRSERLKVIYGLVNLLTFFTNLDIIYLQYVVIASNDVGS
jgi:2-polyprenyl-3-methyl-5-hydroxy-6-metoxy-1,4-benzoquinol methylase